MLMQDQITIIRAHQEEAPINLIKLANALGVPVYYAGDWKDGLSGMIIRDKDNRYNAKNGYAIFVNKEHSPTRQRFTIAHELAHFILHKDRIGDGISDDALYRSGLSNQIEAEANAFAANILMPWDLIARKMQNGVKTIDTLADLFQVSKSAMSIRLGIPYEN